MLCNMKCNYDALWNRDMWGNAVKKYANAVLKNLNEPIA